MSDSLMHRGPDESGNRLFCSERVSVALGHRRLSIIDVAAGTQPMSNEDGTIWITYNGEIYNHAGLRTELMKRGHRYRTRCDTETIVHAYEEWGADCVHRFRGMFAFVIWDGRNEQLFAARDRMGIKPLYYMSTGPALLCGSEIKALFASGWCTPQLNLEAVPEHLTLGYLAGEATLFRGVKKLLPGHHLLWKDGELRTDQYWDIPVPNLAAQTKNELELVHQFLQLFRESVQSHLMSDVPIGVFLSGGLDSSAIAATMAERMSEPVKTFSVGFESQYFSEFDFARKVASTIGADHYEVVLKPDQMLARLPKYIWHEDEPIRNASSVALAEVAHLARSEVKVVLTGEGSDELFAGYERYWATLINMRWGAVYQRVVPHWVRDNCIRQTIGRWPLPLSVRNKISHTFLNYSARPEELVFENWHATFAPRHFPWLLSADAYQVVKDVDPYVHIMQLFEQRPIGDMLDRMLYTDQKAYLVELLRKQDTMSMAASIESRVPFLDHRLVESAVQVPAKSKIRRFHGKHLVKRAMRQILPNAIIDRKKMGFPVPISQWFRGRSVSSIRTLLISEQTKEHGIFNTDYLAQLLDEHVQGARDNSDELWAVLNFELWTRVFIDGRSCASVSDELVESFQLPRPAC